MCDCYRFSITIHIHHLFILLKNTKMDTERRAEFRVACREYAKAYKRTQLIVQGRTKHKTELSKSVELQELTTIIKKNYDKAHRFLLQADTNGVKYMSVSPTSLMKGIADIEKKKKNSETIDEQFYLDCIVIKEYQNAITT